MYDGNVSADVWVQLRKHRRYPTTSAEVVKVTRREPEGLPGCVVVRVRIKVPDRRRDGGAVTAGPVTCRGCEWCRAVDRPLSLLSPDDG